MTQKSFERQKPVEAGDCEEWYALIPIRFTDPTQRDLAFDTMFFGGMVEYTDTPGVYKVPPHVLEVLKKKHIAYEPTDPELRGKV